MPKIKLKPNGGYFDSPDEIIQYVDDNNVVKFVAIAYHDDNMRAHRDDGPAVITYDEATKMITTEVWCKHGDCHREDGPAMICYNLSGSITKEHWRVNDKLHKIDGPATIHYREDGTVHRSYMQINGLWITKKKMADILGLPNARQVKYPLSREHQTTLKLIYQ